MRPTLKSEGEAGYNQCEDLLVCSWRLIMARGADCPLVAQRFKCACGASGDEAFAAFCTFLCALALAQRRCLLVNFPGARVLTADEERMLALIACAQNQRDRALDAHLCWLAQRLLRRTLEQSVRELAAALSVRDLRLHAPEAPAFSTDDGRTPDSRQIVLLRTAGFDRRAPARSADRFEPALRLQ